MRQSRSRWRSTQREVGVPITQNFQHHCAPTHRVAVNDHDPRPICSNHLENSKYVQNMSSLILQDRFGFYLRKSEIQLDVNVLRVLVRDYLGCRHEALAILTHAAHGCQTAQARWHGTTSTFRWVRLSTHQHNESTSMFSPCSHAHFGRVTTARVSSPRDGCLHKPAHAPRSLKHLLVQALHIPFFESECWQQKHGSNMCR